MRSALIILVAIAACSDPTKVAPAPKVGAIAGAIVIQANQKPVAGVQVTIKSYSDSSYSAQDVSDSLGTFFQNDVPAGLGQFQLRHLPTGCDSVLVAGFAVNGGIVDSTTVQLPCGS